MVVPVELYSNCSPKHYVSIFEVLRPLPCLRSLSTRRSLLIGVGGLTAAQGGAVALRAYQAATCLQKAFLLLGPFLRAAMRVYGVSEHQRHIIGVRSIKYRGPWVYSARALLVRNRVLGYIVL